MTQAVAVDCESWIGLIEPTSIASQPSVNPPRFCMSCTDIIPDERLKAMPSAQQCVSCLRTAGDVQLHHTNRAKGIPGAKVLVELTEAPAYDTKARDRARVYQDTHQTINTILNEQYEEVDTCNS